MIVHAVSCPHPPLLLPDLGDAGIDEIRVLRNACLEAITDLVRAKVDVVAAVGAAPTTGPYGTDLPSPVRCFAPDGEKTADAGGTLPLSLAVAAGLTRALEPPVELHGTAPDATTDECVKYGRWLSGRPERVGLLVMADGSARRSVKAPGYLDARAAGADQAVEAGLCAGRTEPLLALEPKFAAELLIAGRAGWQVLAGACEDREVRARCYYSGDPFGVWYPVFGWSVNASALTSAGGPITPASSSS